MAYPWGVILVYFSPYFYFFWGMVGKRAVKSGDYIEFIVARLPTLQIWAKKKVKGLNGLIVRCFDG